MLKKFVALGTDKGYIHLVPISTLFSLNQNVLENASCFVFKLEKNNSPITCLYATEVKQTDKDRLLISGSEDGWVTFWDLEQVFFL